MFRLELGGGDLGKVGDFYSLNRGEDQEEGTALRGRIGYELFSVAAV